MRHLLSAVAILLATPGCVLDRTGQSATEAFKRDLVLHGTRLGNLETQFDRVEARVTQLEELTRARGQDEIMRMENLEQIRQETARLRGDLEVLQHEYGQTSNDGLARYEDHALRVAWLEARADQLEAAMGLEMPAPPVIAELVTVEGEPMEGAGEPPESDGTEDLPTLSGDDPTVTDPAAMIALAEEHLAAGRERAAEAVLGRFLELHPDHERAAEAMYRRAEASFNAGDYPAAVLRFQMVIDRHKQTPWASWAMLRQGEAFDAQGQSDNARLFYEDVIRIWPKSKAAKDAKAKLSGK